MCEIRELLAETERLTSELVNAERLIARRDMQIAELKAKREQPAQSAQSARGPEPTLELQIERWR
jgi:hypothetical protein